MSKVEAYIGIQGRNMKLWLEEQKVTDTLDFRRQIFKNLDSLKNRLSVFKDPAFRSLWLDLTEVRLVDRNPVETIAAIQRINNSPAVVMVWSVDLRDISRIKYFVEKRKRGESTIFVSY